MIAHVHIQNRAGFFRVVGKAKSESSMAINNTEASSETNEAHFLYILLNFVNSISAMTNTRKQASPIIKIFSSLSLGALVLSPKYKTAKNIPQVTHTRQMNIKAWIRRLWLWAVKRWNSSSKIFESKEGFHHREEARSKNKGIQPFFCRVSTCE